MNFDEILPCEWEEGLHCKNYSWKLQKWVNSFTPFLPLLFIHLLIEQMILIQELKVKKSKKDVHKNPACLQGAYRLVNK